MEKIRVRSTILRAILSYEPSGLAALLGVKTEPTALMKMGSMAHCCLLENDNFSKNFATYEGRKGTKSYIEAQETGLEPVKTEEAKKAQEMALVAKEYLKKFANINKIFNSPNAKKELFLDWVDEKFYHTGKIDFYDPDSKTLIDYKTTSYPVATKGLWSKEVDKRIYHLQMAYYKILLEKNSLPVKDVYHIVQSMEPPYLLTVFKFTRDSLEIGEKLVGSALVQVEYSIEQFNSIQPIIIEEEASNPYLHGFEDVMDGF